MKTTNKLVVAGSINIDHILAVPHFPAPGETLTGQGYQVAFGGKGANQAVAAARSGASACFIACVGDDNVGQQVTEQLRVDTVDTSLISVCPGESTGVALIFVNGQGENLIGIHAGANQMLTAGKLTQCQDTIAHASALLMQLETPLDSVLAAAKIAAKHHTRVILNPAPAQPLPDVLLSLVDIITPNETEAEKLTGVRVWDDAGAASAASVLHNKGIPTVIITLGRRGVWLSVGGEGQRIAGFQVNAVDTIAAGDTFNGALVTALLEDQPLASAIRFAHAAAAIAVTRRGAQPAIPWRDEIEQFLQQH